MDKICPGRVLVEAFYDRWDVKVPILRLQPYPLPPLGSTQLQVSTSTANPVTMKGRSPKKPTNMLFSNFQRFAFGRMTECTLAREFDTRLGQDAGLVEGYSESRPHSSPKNLLALERLHKYAATQAEYR